MRYPTWQEAIYEVRNWRRMGIRRRPYVYKVYDGNGEGWTIGLYPNPYRVR